MTHTVHSVQSMSHYIEIDGESYDTTFRADEFITPKVEVDGNKTIVTYAERDMGWAENPRTFFDSNNTMVVTKSGDRLTLDEPDRDIANVLEVAEELVATGNDSDIYFLTECGGCWNRHTPEEVEEGLCQLPSEVILVAREDEIFSDGSSFGTYLTGGYYDLDSLEGAAAMATAWKEGTGNADVYDLMRAYLSEAHPDITGFMRWGIQGYSQGDWAEGYIYTTVEVEDPIAYMQADVDEYQHYYRGDVYMVVRETYIDGEAEDFDTVGGLYGEEYAQQVVNDSKGYF